MSTWKRRGAFGVLAFLLAVAPALGQRSAPKAAPDQRSVAEEVRDDPPLPPPRYAPRPPIVRRYIAAQRIMQTVQVNVNAGGLNIVGDAANEPSIAMDWVRPNRIAIGWRQFDNVASNFRQAGWAYSRDAGHTWTFPGVIDPGLFRSDPVLDSNLDGDFYYYSLTSDFTCDLFKSLDGGVTWSAGVEALGGDKAWMAVDRTGGIGSGNVYAYWKPGAIGCCGNNIFARSSDAGQTFDDPIPIPRNPIRGTIAVGPDGEVYVVGQSGSTFALAKSTTVRDPGNPPALDWSNTINLGGSLITRTGPNPGGMLGQVWVAVDHSNGPSRGNVYVLSSVDPGGSDPLDVMFIRSTDGGLTWSAPLRVNDDAVGTDAWQWFGTMSVAPDGRIDVVFNDTRNSGLANMSELFYSSSNDGGETWSVNERLSPAWNSHVGWPNQNKIGDYYHMVSDAVGANLAWAATFNDEQDVYFMRLGEFDCNGNEVPDPDDISGGFSTDLNHNGIPDECECLGNLNGDFERDLSDLGILLADFGCTSNCVGDIDGDGDTDLADLGIMLSVFGQVCP